MVKHFVHYLAKRVYIHILGSPRIFSPFPLYQYYIIFITNIFREALSPAYKYFNIPHINIYLMLDFLRFVVIRKTAESGIREFYLKKPARFRYLFVVYSHIKDTTRK